MNKKFVLIIVAVVLIGLVVFYFASKKSSQAPADQNVSYNKNGVSIAYDKTTGQVKKYDSENQIYQKIDSLKNAVPTYLELSPDQKSYLYTTDPTAGSDSAPIDDSSNLTVKSLDHGFPEINLQSVFDPQWFNDSSVIYQSLAAQNKGKIVLKDVKTGKELKSVSIGDTNPNEIDVLDSSHVIIYQYSSDVGDISAKILNLDTEKQTDFAKGNGLRVKTIPPSHFVAYQIINGDQPMTKLVDWSTRQEILTLNRSLENITWTNDSQKVYYVKDSMLISFNPTTKNEGLISEINPEVTGLVVLPTGNVLVRSSQGDETIPIN